MVSGVLYTRDDLTEVLRCHAPPTTAAGLSALPRCNPSATRSLGRCSQLGALPSCRSCLAQAHLTVAFSLPLPTVQSR